MIRRSFSLANISARLPTPPPGRHVMGENNATLAYPLLCWKLPVKFNLNHVRIPAIS